MSKIVLIEPDVILGKQYQKELEGDGHLVQLCRTVSQAIDYLDQNSVDLVITELILPSHNGLEFLYEFRSYADWRHVPVIVLTFADVKRFADTLGYKSLDISASLSKTQISLAELAQQVNAVLAKQKSSVT